MTVEVISGMAGRALRLDHIPGGIPALTSDEIMGCLAGLEKGPELLLRAAVVGQPVVKELLLEGFHLAVTLAVANGWRAVRGKPVLRQCAAMAIEEIVWPGTYMCQRCGGTGRVADTNGNAGRQVCGICEGHRTVPMSGRRCAERCQLDEKAWRDRWRFRFMEIRQGVFDWYWTGVKHVNRQLRDTEPEL